MLDKARAEELVDGLDLESFFACPACLFELAWEIRLGHTPHWQTVSRIADWNWEEMKESLFQAVLEARMRELRFADEALTDLEHSGFRTALARAVVVQLAERMADEITHTSSE
jgi:hypothetical protein